MEVFLVYEMLVMRLGFFRCYYSCQLWLSSLPHTFIRINTFISIYLSYSFRIESAAVKKIKPTNGAMVHFCGPFFHLWVLESSIYSIPYDVVMFLVSSQHIQKRHIDNLTRVPGIIYSLSYISTQLKVVRLLYNPATNLALCNNNIINAKRTCKFVIFFN